MLFINRFCVYKFGMKIRSRDEIGTNDTMVRIIFSKIKLLRYINQIKMDIRDSVRKKKRLSRGQRWLNRIESIEGIRLRALHA